MSGAGIASAKEPWWAQPQLWVEAFATLNIAFLTLDICIAHSTNQFRSKAEYIPLYFSAAAPLVLAFALAVRHRWPAVWKDLGYLVGWVAVVMGCTGVILHLQSRFFYDRTLQSLTYSAPFAAPLAFSGLGLLLILNRMVDPESLEWSQWVLLLALGGFGGNFVFSLADHAQNGFFYRTEWVPVVASALAVGFLIVPLLMRVTRRYLDLCMALLLVEGAVGVWGFALHAAGNLEASAGRWFDRFVYDAPPLAPLLLPNLVVLAAIGLWQLRERQEEGSTNTLRAESAEARFHHG